LSKNQTRKNKSTWPWFVDMIIVVEDLAKGEGVLKGVMKVLELEKMKMSYWNLNHSCLSF
jgi:mannose/fructose/N-acetylgalactosamine-specific phosphotransferase system component IIB